MSIGVKRVYTATPANEYIDLEDDTPIELEEGGFLEKEDSL